MRTKTFLWTLLSTAVVLATATGCTTTDEKYEYIRIQETTYSFLGDGNEPQVINIEASSEVTAEPSASWITLSDQTETSLTVSVTDNELDEERTGIITLTAGNAYAEITIVQLPRTNNMPVYNYYGAYDMGAAMSPNGRYCVGTRHVLNEDNSYSMYPTFYDLKTGDVIEVGPLLNDQYSLEKPMAVTDQGTAFVYTSQNFTAAITIDGDVFIPEVPEGSNGNTANVQGVSEDGSTWVGFYYPEPLNCRPLKWVDGIPEELEMPELTYRGDKPATWCMARGMSLDGSVIYGTQWEDFTTGMVYWKDGKLDYVGKDCFKRHTEKIKDATGNMVDYPCVDGMRCTAELQKMSPNGTWIAGNFYEEVVDADGNMTTNIYPAFYNTVTETTTIFRDNPGCAAITATEDGIAVIANGTTMMTSGFVVDLNTGANLGDCLSYIKEQMGINVSDGYITKFSPDKQTILGNMMKSSALGTEFTQFSVSPRPAK